MELTVDTSHPLYEAMRELERAGIALDKAFDERVAPEVVDERAKRVEDARTALAIAADGYQLPADPALRDGGPHNIVAHPLLVLCPRLGRWAHVRTKPLVPTWGDRWLTWWINGLVAELTADPRFAQRSPSGKVRNFFGFCAYCTNRAERPFVQISPTDGPGYKLGVCAGHGRAMRRALEDAVARWSERNTVVEHVDVPGEDVEG